MKLSADQPIGIFDSGIGGLTVANAIIQHLPEESLIYFGDTAHLPYGDKSPEAILNYSEKISDFLLQKDCKMIVIACNTASSVAYNSLRIYLKNKALVVNVIDPVVEYVVNSGIKKAGIIGTKRTIESNVYKEKLLAEAPEMEVFSLATPLLAPMIEEGFCNHNISKAVISSYLSRPEFKKIDALILACTHYPLIKEEISNFFDHSVEIIDSPAVVAKHVEDILSRHRLLSNKKEQENHFFVSDYTKSFEQTTRIFYTEKVDLQHCPIWGR